MAKGESCRILPCKNIMPGKGTVCGSHRQRKGKFGSYDLPDHKGMPSFYVAVPSLPEGIFKICPKHGELTEDQVYPKNYKDMVNSYNCKKCMLGDNIRRKYKGLNGIEDYEQMFAEQDGKCGMCGTSENNTKRKGKTKRFNIDHCHKTGKVRGLLCSFCNSLIGYARDNIETLQSAIEYLRNHE